MPLWHGSGRHGELWWGRGDEVKELARDRVLHLYVMAVQQIATVTRADTMCAALRTPMLALESLHLQWQHRVYTGRSA